jgi:glycerol-1-phosphate dehydrogenase [NAD(P)+]
MDINLGTYLNRNIHCGCGRVHYCPIEHVIIENGALEKLPELVKGYHRILLVADENTWKTCGDEVALLLTDKLQSMLVYQSEGYLIPNEQAIDLLDQEITEETDFVIGIGSGVINDICKYVAYKRELNYAIVITAPSMDGYASSGTALIIEGMKVTYTVCPPKIIIADIDVVKNAPLDMIRSGYGDIIGKYSALNDWRFSRIVNDEFFCEDIYQLVYDVTNAVRDNAKQITERDEGAITFLTEALILIGVAMSMAGSTRPASGSEHHLSHFFEITGLIHHQPYFFHGTDVAYSTVITASMRERICKADSLTFKHIPSEIRDKAYRRIYAAYADNVRAIQDAAGYYEKDLETIYRQEWSEIVKVLASCPTGDEIKTMLIDVGFDMDEFEAMYGKEKIADAMFWGKDLKDRYSVLWLYHAMFADEAKV